MAGSPRREADAPGRDVEFGGVEHEEARGRGHVEAHRHGAGEGAGGEVGREAQVVAPRRREAGQPRLAPELLGGLLRRRRRHRWIELDGCGREEEEFAKPRGLRRGKEEGASARCDD